MALSSPFLSVFSCFPAAVSKQLVSMTCTSPRCSAYYGDHGLTPWATVSPSPLIFSGILSALPPKLDQYTAFPTSTWMMYMSRLMEPLKASSEPWSLLTAQWGVMSRPHTRTGQQKSLQPTAQWNKNPALPLSLLPRSGWLIYSMTCDSWEHGNSSHAYMTALKTTCPKQEQAKAYSRSLSWANTSQTITQWKIVLLKYQMQGWVWWCTQEAEAGG